MRGPAEPNLDPRGVRRILAIRRKALGDALVTWPAVLRLAASFPRARIDLVVDRPFAPLLEGLAGPVRVVAWPPDGEGGTAGWTRRLRDAGYDLAIDWLGSPRTALWTALSGAPVRVGYDLRWRRWAYNVVVPRNRQGDVALAQFAGEGFLDPLRALGLAPAPWAPMPPAPAEAPAGEWAAWLAAWVRREGPRLGVVLSATWPAKAWPPEHAVRLVELARTAGAALLLIPGPGDETIVQAVAARAPAATVAPPTTLPQLAQLLPTLDLLVATDSGARHLAALLGVPTVTLFGPTDPRGWNRAHPDHVAVRTGEPCSPCDLTECPLPGHPCMRRLTGDLAWAKVQALLSARGRDRGAPAGPGGKEVA